jgi:NitT/TauT family transport system substrate-binding protein
VFFDPLFSILVSEIAMNGQPKTPFYLALFLVVIGLLAYAAYRSDLLAPKGNVHESAGAIDPNALGQTAEAKDSASVTTVKEYTFRPIERLPEVKGISAYKPLEDNTVRFALNVWAGWGPIILANEGFKPGKVWKTAKGDPFKVELVLIDNPVAMRDAYAAGGVHIGWATLDMVPLFMEGFVDKTGQPRDSRVMPRI